MREANWKGFKEFIQQVSHTCCLTQHRQNQSACEMQVRTFLPKRICNLELPLEKNRVNTIQACLKFSWLKSFTFWNKWQPVLTVENSIEFMMTTGTLKKAIRCWMGDHYFRATHVIRIQILEMISLITTDVPYTIQHSS